MTAVTIFAIGTLVTILTVAAVVLVGLSEAADPAHSRPEDLTEWESSVVGRERPEKTSPRQGR